MRKYRIIFCGEGGPDLRFVEIEDKQGRSVRLGTWTKEVRGGQTYHVLEIMASPVIRPPGPGKDRPPTH